MQTRAKERDSRLRQRVKMKTIAITLYAKQLQSLAYKITLKFQKKYDIELCQVYAHYK